MQQMNLFSPTGGLLEFEPRSPINGKYPRVPDNFGLSHSQAINSVSQANIGQFSQGPRIDITPLSSLPQAQPSANILKQASLNIMPTPLLLNPSMITNFSPIVPIQSVPIVQGSNYNLPPVTNIPTPQGLLPNMSPVPIALNQVTLYPQLPLNVPAASLQNQIMQAATVNSLPTPNIAASTPLQNYVPLSQAPIQPEKYHSILPIEYDSNTLYSPKVSALPPVLPANILTLYDCLSLPAQIPEQEHTPVPINLQINMPSPTIPEPQITIITAYPSAPVATVPESTDSSDVSFGMYPPYPLPPIIIKGRRSRSRSWLPLFLIAVIANDRCCGGCGCCNCANACQEIPIPYPIPIPTNNPIIVGTGCRSCKKGLKGKTCNKNGDKN